MFGVKIEFVLWQAPPDEAIWVRQLALETHARLVVCFPSLSVDLRLQHLLEMGGAVRKLALLAKAGVLPSRSGVSPSVQAPPRVAAQRSLTSRAALFLDQIALGLLDDATSLGPLAVFSSCAS